MDLETPKLKKPAFCRWNYKKKSATVSHLYVSTSSNILLKEFFFLYHVFLVPSTHFRFNSSFFRSLKSKYTLSIQAFKFHAFSLFLSVQAFKFQHLPLCVHAFNPSLQMSMNQWCHPSTNVVPVRLRT